jgi:Na+-transporting methylmalonyl-CoA/oxaloacetate decarboxylase gamma subunit
MKKLRYCIFGVLMLCAFFTAHVDSVLADSQSLSVTPPLFQISVEPGNLWQSSIRVVNTNPYPLTVYAKVANFAAEGEGGRGRFLPILDSGEDKATLAEWIVINKGPYVVPPEQTAEISFFIEVPKDASPGGHFAAILIGTEPPQETDEPLALLTAQSVASLFFVRIEGDIIENATIREFSILDRSIEDSSAEFSLRFENKGNVHLQPRGNIVITNMWGKTRGIIPINEKTHFGNVLPNSIRDFKFTWKGERSLADIGLYKAIVTLGYGEDEVKSADATAHFWVIPIKGLLLTLLIIALFIYAISWMIKRYVRHMLVLAGVDPDEAVVSKTAPRKHSYDTVAAPITRGAHDLRTRLRNVTELFDFVRTIVTFVLQYKLFFASLAIVIVSFIVLVRYVAVVSEKERAYEVTIDEGDTTRVIKSEEINQVTQ